MAKKKAVVSEEIETQTVVEDDKELGFDDFTPEELQRANVSDADLSDLDEPEKEEVEEDLISLEDEIVEDEPEPEPEPEPKKSKLDDMPPDQLRKSYENLEKVVGRLGQELGDLRKAKTVEEPKTPEEKIQSMSLKELEDSIAFFKSEILKPNAAIEDDDYSQKVILYNDLKEEKTLRRISMEQNSKSAKVNNQNIISEFSTAWKETLGDETLDSVVKFATSRLSDENGNITKDDLEVALHKVNPVLYTNAIKMTAGKQEKDRIIEAQTKKQPRISASGNNTSAVNTISMSKLKEMDAVELADLFERLPIETVLKIERALGKK